MFGVLAFLEFNKIGLYLVPRFGATLSILLLLPEAPVAQPYALIVGSVVGASIGTLLSLFATGLGMAIVACLVISIMHAFHPPVVALVMFPLLVHPGNWFPPVCCTSVHRNCGVFRSGPEQAGRAMAGLPKASRGDKEKVRQKG
jgi:CBS-domain-containing membrane protein